MTISHRQVINKQSSLITIFLEGLRSPGVELMFLGCVAGIWFIYLAGPQKHPLCELIAFFICIVPMLVGLRLYRARIWRREYEAAVVRKHGVLEAFFKADESGFEIGLEGGISMKCNWLSLRTWSEGADAFVFAVDVRRVRVAKAYFLNAEEAIMLREFLKKNLPEKAV